MSSSGDQVADSNAGTSALAKTGPQDHGHVGAVLGEDVDTRNPTAMTLAVAAFRDAQASREILETQLRRIAEDRNEFRERWHLYRRHFHQQLLGCDDTAAQPGVAADRQRLG